MSGTHRCLIDSNVLIYMYDDRAPDFQQQATRVFEYLVRRHRAALSAQCLTEFFNGVTRRTHDPMQVSDAAARVERISSATLVYPLTSEVVREAVEAVGKHQMSIWDALIWAVAFRNGVPVIVTEDMQSQPVIAGVRYINPFDSGFDIESL